MAFLKFNLIPKLQQGSFKKYFIRKIAYFDLLPPSYTFSFFSNTLLPPMPFTKYVTKYGIK